VIEHSPIHPIGDNASASDLREAFEKERRACVAVQGKDAALKQRSVDWILATAKTKYSYQFDWMGRPVIQFPQDLLAMHELIWNLKPDLIVETGVAHGGSLIFYASMLELVGGTGRVLGIDIEIRPHNREALEAHPMFHRIDLLEGSSTDESMLEQVRLRAAGKKVLVCLDSNHTHEHVFRELQLYSPLVQKGGYVVVFDTIVEFMPKAFFPNRPWGPGNNPWTAVQEFLKTNDRFEIDPSIPDKVLITVAPDGYLRCIKD
jgi:cephalosporin hydroxylase